MPTIKNNDSIKEWAETTRQIIPESANLNRDIKVLTSQIKPNKRIKNTSIKSRDKLPDIVSFFDNKEIPGSS